MSPLYRRATAAAGLRSVHWWAAATTAEVRAALPDWTLSDRRGLADECRAYVAGIAAAESESAERTRATKAERIAALRAELALMEADNE